MKVTKIKKPVSEPVVATIEVTQKELDLLAALINECHADTKVGDNTIFGIYCDLENSGGSARAWNMNKTGSGNSYSVSFKPTYTRS